MYFAMQSCIGWGLTGACTARAQTLRWMPGQKKIRYDVAGFLTLVKVCPLITTMIVVKFHFIC